MHSQHDRQKPPSSSFRLLVEYDGTRYSGWQRQGPRRANAPGGAAQHGRGEAATQGAGEAATRGAGAAGAAQQGPGEATTAASNTLTWGAAGAAQHGPGEAGAAQQGPREAPVKTIAGAICRVLHQAGVQIVNFKGAGRTDAGVHALGQVAHLHLEDPMKASELQYILERGLPYDIAVPGLEPCPLGFDARHDAVSRTYLYQIALRKSAFSKNSTWWPKLPLDMRLIEEAWPLFEGNRSMAAFADLEDGEDPNCQIYSCRADMGGHLLLLRVTARFFLRRQVRRMVGAVVNCAMGRADAARLREDIAAPAPESALRWAELAAPAAGLFLERVDYRGGGGAPAGRQKQG